MVCTSALSPTTIILMIFGIMGYHGLLPILNRSGVGGIRLSISSIPPHDPTMKV